MKKILLILIASVFVFSSYAQLVTISGENQIPQIGQEIEYYNINTFGFNLAGVPDGINTIWDFSTLTVNDAVTFTYTDATLEEAADEFPEATIAEAISGIDGLMYFKTDDYFMARKGATGDMYMNYDADSALLLSFPITAGGNVECDYTGMLFAASLEMDIPDGHVEMNADAQGTIILPNGTTLDNVLRVNVVESFSGMYDFGTGPTEILTVDDDFYYWYHEDYTNPIFVYGTTTIGGMSNDETEALRYQPIIVSDIENNISNKEVAYPNPTSGIVNITNSESYFSGRVLDMNGKEVMNFKPQAQIDMSNLENGVYFILLNGQEGKQLIRTVLQK